MNPLITAAGMVAPTVIPPLRPTGPGWRQLDWPPDLQVQWDAQGIVAERWTGPGGSNVISAVETAELGEATHVAPHYHISISRRNPRTGKNERCPSNEAQYILRRFQLEGWVEDNHVPGGLVRNYWRPVADDYVGIKCKCEAHEPTIREDKGDYIWRPAGNH